MKTYRIAAIPGDGIGTEVVEAGVEVLAAVARRDGGFAVDFDRFDWGGEYYANVRRFSSPAPCRSARPRSAADRRRDPGTS